MRHRVGSDAGQAGIVLLMVLFVILAVAGLVVDGGAVVTGKIGLQAEADAAARRGAEAVDVAAFEATGAPVLNVPAAEAAALSYVSTTCPACSATAAPSAGSLTVTLHRAQPTWFLRAVGIGSVTVAASATAGPVTP